MPILNKTPQQTRSDESRVKNRSQLNELYKKSPIPLDEIVVNFPLYTRSSAIAKMLYIQELYKKILNVPGVIMEFGVWWGANLALFESFRAIYEPYNYTRRVIGFDTFDGYASLSKQDGASEFIAEGNYRVPEGYLSHLTDVLDCHNRENVMSNNDKYKLVEGDASKKIFDYLGANTETIISLAYFDMQLYHPTKACLSAIKPYLTKGSVIALDEINCPEFPGETVALREVFGLSNIRLVRSEILPDRSFFVVE
jgi:hypothetical protein